MLGVVTVPDGAKGHSMVCPLAPSGTVVGWAEASGFGLTAEAYVTEWPAGGDAGAEAQLRSRPGRM